jgi:hypothetical protein
MRMVVNWSPFKAPSMMSLMALASSLEKLPHTTPYISLTPVSITMSPRCLSSLTGMKMVE